VRSHVLVGDLGERIAATYYRVELLPQFTPGHDLVDRRRRRINVKTLQTPSSPSADPAPICSATAAIPG
jgi:hypothetical protein